MLKGYIQPFEVAAGLGYDLSDAQLLAEVAVAIEFCELAVDQYCDTQFQWEAGASKLYDGSGTNMLTLGSYLQTLTGVWTLDETGARYTQLTDVVPQPTPLRDQRLYRWLQRRQAQTETGEVITRNVFPAGLANIEVVGDWGYTPEKMPTAIKQALLYAVKYFFDLRLYNDLVQMDSGLGRTMVFKTPKQGTDQPVHYLPEASRHLLAKWKNSRWMTE